MLSYKVVTQLLIAQQERQSRAAYIKQGRRPLTNYRAQ
nr:MAG TPA: hypothetical protein [Caudoviricetes sp.]